MNKIEKRLVALKDQLFVTMIVSMGSIMFILTPVLYGALDYHKEKARQEGYNEGIQVKSNAKVGYYKGYNDGLKNGYNATCSLSDTILDIRNELKRIKKIK